MKILFAVSAIFLAYTYLGYPLVIALLGTFFKKRVEKRYQEPGVSVVLAARDEEGRIEGRIRNLLEQDYPPEKLEVVVVSDGSRDRTAEIARGVEDARVKVVETGSPVGKAVALNMGVETATHEILLFADARQSFSRNVVAELVALLYDRSVGAVSGELVLAGEEESELGEGVGLYWKYEKFIRRMESAFDSVVGASGAIYAVRRELFEPLPPGTLLDDFLLPMRIVLKGRRVLFTRAAKAYDRVSPTARAEFARKVRTLAGNFQALRLEPALLDPRRNRLFFQLFSHKLARLAAPYFCVGALVGSALAPGMVYRFFFLGQIVFYASSLFNFLPLAGRSLGALGKMAWTFLVLNAAAVSALWVTLRGREGQTWKKA